MNRRIRPYLKVVAILLTLAFGWVGLRAYVFLVEPLDNRSYAETWQGAPLDELATLPEMRGYCWPTTRSDQAPGRALVCAFNGWRKLQGRTYPGSVLAPYLGDIRMHSGVVITPAHTAHCEIEFAAGADGRIDKITYAGNDCD